MVEVKFTFYITLLFCSLFVLLNYYFVTEKELNMSAVLQIFGCSSHHYMLIASGLNVKAADLIPIPDTAQNNLIIVFQRWFDANKDVNWDALIKLCDVFQDDLGKAKSNLLAYLGKNFNISY